MEVHPPHEPVHSWREALVHIGLMTVGLFIALMLEALVEYAHHREIVLQARENIRLELQHNHETIGKDLKYLQGNVQHVKANTVLLQSFLSGHGPQHGDLTEDMEFDSLHTSAWQTARDTGALAYMPYEEVQRDADIYTGVDAVNRHADTVAETQFAALAPALMGYELSKMPHDELMSILRGNAQAQIGLITEEHS